MQEISRRYRFSDGTLTQITDDILDSAQRDATELAEYGVLPATLAAITAARTAFVAAPSDEFLMGAMMNATQTKNELRDQVLYHCRQIADRAKIRFGESSGTYAQFATTALSKQNDNDLVRVARSVAYAANAYAAELLEEGITPVKITDFETLVANFDAAIDTKRRAIKNRDQSVIQRITLGNELYELVSKLAAKGKLCWIDRNEALYNDYVIYGGAEGGGQVVEGNIAAQTIINLSVEDTSAATVFTLRNRGGVPLTFYFATEPTDPTGPSPVVVEPNTEQVIPAPALGYSAQHPRFNVHNTFEAPGSYEVVWE